MVDQCSIIFLITFFRRVEYPNQVKSVMRSTLDWAWLRCGSSSMLPPLQAYMIMELLDGDLIDIYNPPLPEEVPFIRCRTIYC